MTKAGNGLILSTYRHNKNNPHGLTNAFHIVARMFCATFPDVFGRLSGSSCLNPSSMYQEIKITPKKPVLMRSRAIRVGVGQ